jgi:hypothetical protein
MSESAADVPEATLALLRSLNAGRGFHPFPAQMDWARFKSFRTPYHWPRLSPPPWEADNRPARISEMSSCWADLEDYGLIRVGHLADGQDNPISPFGFQLTEKGVAALPPQENE